MSAKLFFKNTSLTTRQVACYVHAIRIAKFENQLSHGRCNVKGISIPEAPFFESRHLLKKVHFFEKPPRNEIYSYYVSQLLHSQIYRLVVKCIALYESVLPTVLFHRKFLQRLKKFLLIFHC